MKTTHPYTIGHPTLRLEQLEPQKSPTFSLNLHRYLEAHGHFYEDGGTLEGVFQLRPNVSYAKDWGAGALVVGIHDGEFVTGSRMISVLCNGKRAERYAYPIGAQVEQITDFWDKYLKIGRCAVDQKHEMYFDNNRFTVAGDVRTCQWCGVQHKRILTPRVVHDESWLQMQATTSVSIKE